ncbi:MAG: iron chaperone [Pseudonocardiaceae bacterium]
MYGKSDAATPDEYIDALDEPRRSELRRLHELISAAVPELRPTMEFGMPGYGKYHYRYASGREGDAAVISMASNKNYISLYVSAVVGDRYLAESFQDRLPKASIGKSCIRFKRLSDLDPDALTDLLRAAAANPPGTLTG